MEHLDINITSAQIDRYLKEQATTAWGLGECLGAIEAACNAAPGWFTAVRTEYPLLNNLTPGDAHMYVKAAKAYGAKERAYNLPWCMYLYALKRTDDPADWIRTAAKEGWTLAGLKAHVGSRVASAAPEKEALPPIKMYETTVKNRNGMAICVIAVYVDLFNAEVEPRVDVNFLTDEPLYRDEAQWLHGGLYQCLSEINDYLRVDSVSKG